MSPTALGLSRFRSRRTRVRREPIDLELLAAEFAEPAAPVVTAAVAQPRGAPVAKSEDEILRALEAEVARKRAIASAPVVEPEPIAEPEPEPIVAMPTVAPVAGDPIPRPTTNVGLPLDQVQAWLDQVEADLRMIEARVEYLQAEQSRLQSQHQLVAELIGSSTPV